MDNREGRNKITNEMEQRRNNKGKLKVDEQIKLQKKYTKGVKQQDSPCSSTNYKHNEEDRNLPRKSATHEEEREVSMV
jgi:hypothetical protein